MTHMIMVPSNRTLLEIGYWTELFNNSIQDTKKSSQRSTLPLIRLLVFFLVFFPSIFSSSKRRPLVAPVDAPARCFTVSSHRSPNNTQDVHSRILGDLEDQQWNDLRLGGITYGWILWTDVTPSKIETNTALCFCCFKVCLKGFGWCSKSRNTQLLSDNLRPHGQFETSIAELAADQFGDSPPFSPFFRGSQGEGHSIATKWDCFHSSVEVYTETCAFIGCCNSHGPKRTVNHFFVDILELPTHIFSSMDWKWPSDIKLNIDAGNIRRTSLNQHDMSVLNKTIKNNIGISISSPRTNSNHTCFQMVKFNPQNGIPWNPLLRPESSDLRSQPAAKRKQSWPPRSPYRLVSPQKVVILASFVCPWMKMSKST